MNIVLNKTFLKFKKEKS